MNKFKVTVGTSKSQPIIIIYYNEMRHRYWNGKAINVNIKSRDNPSLLKAAFELKLIEGWRPQLKKKKVKEVPMTVIQALQQGVETKKAQGCSERFIKDVKRIVTLWKRYEIEQHIKNLTLNELQQSHIKNFIIRPNWSAKTQRTVKSTLSPLLAEFKPHLIQSIKLKKPTSTLHKPFESTADILNDIKKFNVNLYRCCLITYGCLLRPHREVRELKWTDFTKDLDYIKLSGSRNKSGRNRIVPVPYYVKEELQKIGFETYLFGDELPNKDYFSTLWGRYKKQSNLLKEEQTLYSFRHSGAIDIFKRTGSLHKLQQAMGHSSLNVSLTYLRGLEVAELKEENMPFI